MIADFDIQRIPKVSTLVDLLEYWAIQQPTKTAYTFLKDGETEELSLNYYELNRKAKAIAAQLQGLKATGERVLLLYPSGLEFIAAFLGCLYAGAIAVPVYPPRRNQKMSRLQGIVADAQAKLALTTTSLVSNIENWFSQDSELAKLKCVSTDNIASHMTFDWQKPDLNQDTLAFLQYTSGSTGMPKGVMVTHGNLLHNEQMIQTACEHGEKTIFVGWLPLFHDMGLIGNILQPLYIGRNCILMSPEAFIQKPVRWLLAISRYRATISGGPNFAYELCIHQITPEERNSLDLSSWEIAFNGAEPIRAQTLEKFATTFAECGFRKSAFYPCYGMAETTLFVSGGIKTAPPIIESFDKAALEQNQAIAKAGLETQTLVGCGRAWLDEKIAIANPESLTSCANGQVGEIWVSSKSVAKGYWNQPEQTEQTFRGYLTDTNEGPFLRTGDLGFLLNGELFVTGRIKDLIIIRGRNYYPQDIELTVEQSHPALRLGCGAAFSIAIDGEEQLVVAQEVKRQFFSNLNGDEIVAAIRQAVSQQHQLRVYGVVLLKTGSLPKTSSGKIKRQGCRACFVAGELLEVYRWLDNFREQPTSKESFSKTTETKELSWLAIDIKIGIVSRLAKQLGISPAAINPRQPFSYYGLSSIQFINIATDLENWLGISIPPDRLFDSPSIEALAHEITQMLNR
ncbi:AMP-binding protein [Chlorogloeopsis fritschii PCC 9212]|uniref:Acyl-CoA synthetase n=1 Tax=Chlorogloeopsis fritschii PCC 6912 TaxID=211165 RepID=A0A3S1FGH8_CHLFR|nr:AMP-binding protein [Chlorogloeopsis fritschii]RUR77902.1 acyl-CoA synthetase [Chlorogloeopsis fritschii PCC 6912]